MEPTQVEIDGVVANVMVPLMPHLPNPVSPPAQPEQVGNTGYDPVSLPVSSTTQRKEMADSHGFQDKSTPPSVSNCYVFKSRLQEYCQKAGLTTPVYETIKEGPSHEPSFRSTVIVNNIRYDSLPGFFNRKAAEQSAAEVALLEISKSVDTKFGISAPVHETGLCKNLLQEYAQKMNYAIPLYECQKDEKRGRVPMYSCVVEIGGIKYIGAAAGTKKEAEIKAARTALLAIQSSGFVSANQAGSSVYTVVPQKKKVPDLGISTQETAAALKPKKGRFKKQQQRKKRRGVKKENCTQNAAASCLDSSFTEGKVGEESVSPMDAVSFQDNIAAVHSKVYVNGQAKTEENATEAGAIGIVGVEMVKGSDVCLEIEDQGE